MKKLTITLITTPILLAGAAALAGMQHHHGYDKCDSGDAQGYANRMNEEEREDWAAHRFEHMSKRLRLSDAQQITMKKLFNDKKTQHQTIRTDMQTFHKAMRNLDPAAADYDKNLAEAKRIAADLAVNKVDQKVSMKAELSQVLTAEQLSNFDNIRARYGESDRSHNNSKADCREHGDYAK